MGKYKVGDRVFWFSEKKKLTVTSVRENAFCKYSCICSDGHIWNWFRENELKPIVVIRGANDINLTC